MKNKIITFLALLPLSFRLKLFYCFKLKRRLNLKNPKLYTEKIQSRKLNLKSVYSELSDKYMVRDYVSLNVGKNYLIPLISAYNSIHEINFDLLPKKFVIKTNFGSGIGHIEIVKDKSKLDLDKIIKKFDVAYQSSYIGAILGEIQYNHIPKKIIVEKFIDNNDSDIEDFKFHIFNSKDGFLQIDFDRFTNHKRNLYDFNWNRLDYDLLYKGGKYQLPSVTDLENLKKIAFKLSEGFDYVRVDLYLVNGQVLFGEMTFTPGSGFEPFSDPKADEKYGSMWLDYKS